jgi:cell division GTPase FtsZ
MVVTHSKGHQMTELQDRINRLADEARDAATTIAGEAPAEGEAAVVEIHHIARRSAAQVEAAAETPARILKLVD